MLVEALPWAKFAEERRQHDSAQLLVTMLLIWPTLKVGLMTKDFWMVSSVNVLDITF